MPVPILMILSAAALVLWVCRYDRYDKEPWQAVLLALASGFAGMWLIGLADDFALRAAGLSREQMVAKAAIIAIIEEGGKLLTILLLARVLVGRHFNDPMDGLIYGRLMGLGMAVEESLFYLSLSPPTLSTLGMEIVRLFAHSLMGGLVGFAIGLGAHPRSKRRDFPALVLGCLALSTLLHFGWNIIAYRPPDPLISRLVPMGVMLTMMALWEWLCGIAETRSRQIFAPAAGSGQVHAHPSAHPAPIGWIRLRRN